MARPNEYFLFRLYSIAVKNWLIDNVYLSSYPSDNNVTVAYTTPDRAWAKYIYPTINGATTSPNINFHLTGYEYAQGENILGFVRDHVSVPNNTAKVRQLKAPLIYKLTYSATIYTRTQSEMDVILYQMISKAHKNAKAAFAVDGQWCELVVGDPRDETNLEPGEAQDTIQRFGVDPSIPRAYLPLDYSDIQRIGEVDLEYDV